ncbi:aryl-alcohol dehydrogenase-like predicted oxidoreductase [Pedobacter cryoconitis]|uniref:aldo/keto reductase n=1 Tax=Pedobacter cryoconitis TaxID=188932 RepID=UPI001845DDF7|nr:aldo/keto reductase [Pedobacter cryoconitis]MBB6270524.1 aryl-alcohol dehydrogenase-like predicted oxidoreductase [Pedobacter cryoconitis]
MIQKRKLGASDISIAPLVFGTNIFGWTADDQMTFKLLDHFTANGFNAIDTADVYSAWVDGLEGGESEKAIGRWLKKSGKRNQIVLATKVGAELSADKKGLSKTYIIKAVEGSLNRLQTDYIDLYQSHYDDLETPIEETLEAYETLIKAGKVRIIGASNFTAERLEASLEISKTNGLPQYQTFQPEYNLFDRAGFEENIKPVTTANSISVINYFSLASGFLTGKYRKVEDLQNSKRSGFVERYMTNRGFKILNALDEVSSKFKTNPAAVSIAWLLANPAITAPIASATNIGQLDDLIRATQLTLDQASVDLLNAASAF